MKIEQFTLTRGLIDGWPTELRRGSGSVVVNSDGSVTITPASGQDVTLDVGDLILDDGNLLLDSDSSSIQFGEAQDLQLHWEAADVLALRRSTNAQALRLYETFTDASNYSRLKIGMTGTNFEIVSEKAGTGTIRNVRVGGGTGAGLHLHANGTDQWTILSGDGALRDNVGTYIQYKEMSAPGVSPANGARLYAVDDGSGNTRIEAHFATGSVQEVAVQNGADVGQRDYAAIRFDDNSSAETIDLTDLYHLVTRFATNGLDEVSAADQANNRLTVGDGRDYRVEFCGSAEAAGAVRTFVFDVFEISQTTANISAISKATPGVVTASGHPFSNGDLCKITGVGGMVEVNDKIYKVAGVSGADFDLQDDEGVSIATGAFTNYTSGGTVALATKTFAHSDRTFSNSNGFGSFSSHWFYAATSGDAMEFYIKNKSDASNLTFEHLNLTVNGL